MSMWLAEYRWLFLVITLVLLGLAYYMTYINRRQTGPWSLWILHATSIVSMSVIGYSLLTS